MIARNVFGAGSASVFLGDGGRNDPDMYLIYEGTQYPGVVIEIAYSQSQRHDGKKLHRLVDDYIVESSGNSQTVIGITISYRNTKRATVSTWCPKQGLDE